TPGAGSHRAIAAPGGRVGGPAPGPARLSRADLVALAKTQPWAFLTFALPAVLQGQAADVEIQTRCAGALIDLGFHSLGRLVLARLTGAMAARSDIAALHAAAGESVSDEITPAQRLVFARQNLDAIASRPVGAPFHTTMPAPDVRASSLETWAASLASRRVFRSPLGHTIEISALQPVAANSTRMCSPKIPAASGPRASTLYLAGVSSGATIVGAFVARPPELLGMVDRIVAIEPDIARFLDALSDGDLRPELSQSRMDILVGPGALASMESLLNERLGLAIIGQVVGATPLSTTVAKVVSDCVARQGAEIERVARELEAREDARGDAQAVERWSGPADRAMRVLLTTTRFSTFVKNSTADIAGALRRAGHDAEVVIEPDDASRLTNLELYRRALKLDPDLVLCINHPRKAVLGPLMTRVPFACFIQDRMPQLFTSEAGRALGPRDFTVGHLHPELFERFGYPRCNVLMFPVPASAEKFAGASIDQELLDRHACEIAYVSHQSHPAQELVRTLGGTMPDRFRASVARLLPAVAGAIAPDLCPLDIAGVSRLCYDALAAERSETPSDEDVAMLASVAGLPIAERLLRHRMLEWAAELCVERGWRLNLYGNGWETHPTLARFARGPLAHDGNLAACYRAARLHLHTGMGGVHHQRVMECALAGGCTLVEIKAHDLELLDWCTRNDIAAELQRAGTPIDLPVAIADHWQAMMQRSLSDRMGLDTSRDRDGLIAIDDATRREPWGAGRCLATTFHGSWMLGDVERSSFWSRETFRAAAISLVESDARRESLSGWQRRWTSANFTYDAFVTRLLETVRGAMAAPGSGSIAAS
ncbi:MAG: hypothetical protein K2X32_10170, partial [Phycisphaerales bacterium]|nr:hypothetical protein [Phycisphaerales bacterium]